MRRHLAAIAAIGVLAMLGTTALAEDSNNLNSGTTPADSEQNINNELAPELQDLLSFPKLGPKTAQLDLGVDISDVALTQQGVATFMASLNPQAQGILFTSCEHYLTTPNSAQSTYTIQFCETLIGG